MVNEPAISNGYDGFPVIRENTLQLIDVSGELSGDQKCNTVFLAIRLRNVPGLQCFFQLPLAGRNESAVFGNPAQELSGDLPGSLFLLVINGRISIQIILAIQKPELCSRFAVGQGPGRMFCLFHGVRIYVPQRNNEKPYKIKLFQFFLLTDTC